MSFNYSVAWSLIYYLFENTEGRLFLGKYMQFMSDNYCREHSAVDMFNKFYPGGYQSMKRGWEIWQSYDSLKDHVWRH